MAALHRFKQIYWQLGIDNLASNCDSNDLAP